MEDLRQNETPDVIAAEARLAELAANGQLEAFMERLSTLSADDPEFRTAARELSANSAELLKSIENSEKIMTVGPLLTMMLGAAAAFGFRHSTPETFQGDGSGQNFGVMLMAITVAAVLTGTAGAKMRNLNQMVFEKVNPFLQALRQRRVEAPPRRRI